MQTKKPGCSPGGILAGNPLNRNKDQGGGVKTIIHNFPASSAETKTLRYLQGNVHDFAWFADKRFIVDHDTLHAGFIQSDRCLHLLYTTAKTDSGKAVNHFAKRAIRYYSSEVAEYPYNIASVSTGTCQFRRRYGVSNHHRYFLPAVL